MPSMEQNMGPLRNILHDIAWKMKLEINTGIEEKHPAGNTHQISNTERWYQNVRFAGSVLVRC